MFYICSHAWSMRVSRERQIFLALCALDEIADQARIAPIQSSFALRFALAFLWSCSDGRDRANYDALWRNLVDVKLRSNQAPSTIDPNLRYLFARAQLHGVMHSLGFELDVVQTRINIARGKPAHYRPVEKQWSSMTQDEKREHSRRARHCAITRIDQPFPKKWL